MKKTYVAYVDEAGDEGLGRLAGPERGGQSHWLILGALVVSAEDDRHLPSWRDGILRRFPNRQSRALHFRTLKHEQKVVVCQEIAARDIAISLAMVHKPSLEGALRTRVIENKGELYDLLVRRLLAHVTDHCRQAAADAETTLHVCFSRRTATDYAAMQARFRMLRAGEAEDDTGIDWSVFDPERMTALSHDTRAGLQLADCITSAYFRGVEPNDYGNVEVSYAKILAARLITVNGPGVLLVPDDPAAAAALGVLQAR